MSLKQHQHGTGVEPVATCEHEESPCGECRSGPLVRPGVCYLGDPCAHAASGGPCKYEPTEIVSLRSRLAAVLAAGEAAVWLIENPPTGERTDEQDQLWYARRRSVLDKWKKVRSA